MTIEVVPIAEAHIESFHACLDSVCREKRFLAQIEAQPLDRVASWVKENIANDAVQFVAVEGPRIVGWCDIFPGWAHAIRHRGTLGMGVLAEYRGRGIGKKLLAAGLAKAKLKGMTRIELEVRADNESAIKLYQDFGFAFEGTRRRALVFDGAYYDSLQMSLLYG